MIVGFGDITPVTTQGRFVVCASILVGIAVLPLQTAALVEALLDFQKEREGKKKIIPSEFDVKKKNDFTHSSIDRERSKQRMVSSSSIHDEYTNPVEYDTQCICTNCGSCPHRNDALFCWNCGSKLV